MKTGRSSSQRLTRLELWASGEEAPDWPADRCCCAAQGCAGCEGCEGCAGCACGCRCPSGCGCTGVKPVPPSIRLSKLKGMPLLGVVISMPAILLLFPDTLLLCICERQIWIFNI